MFKMMRVVILAFVLLTTPTQYAKCYQIQKSPSVLGYSTQLFAADLLMKLGEGNQLISPIMIQSGLFLLPTEGITKNEIKTVLHLSNNDNWVNSYKNFLTSTRRSKQVEINLASAIYIKNKTRFKNSYKKLLRKYGTNLQYVDFSKPEVVAKQINSWVELKTNNKIKDIVDSSLLSATTATLLVTAVYFNGNWKKPFEKEATSTSVFYSHGIYKDETDMMIQTSEFNYAENNELDAKFLELPYDNEDYTMTIVLPKQRDGLPLLQSQIGKIFERQNMELVKTTVKMPKFKFENKMEMTDILKKLGITSLFMDGISFGNSKSENLQINKIVQKTYVDVNEFGTEAAAGMEIEMTSRFGFEDIEIFIADHPFLFFIRQESTGVILFVGRFSNPE